MAKSRAAEILAMLDGATQDDLAEIDKEIAFVDAKLEGLKAARKLIASRLGIKPEPKQPHPTSAARQPRRAPGGGPTVAEKALAHIAKNGPERVAALAEKIGASYGAVHSACRDNQWFDMQTDGVHLTPIGIAAAKEQR